MQQLPTVGETKVRTLKIDLVLDWWLEARAARENRKVAGLMRHLLIKGLGEMTADEKAAIFPLISMHEAGLWQGDMTPGPEPFPDVCPECGNEFSLGTYTDPSGRWWECEKRLDGCGASSRT